MIATVNTYETRFYCKCPNNDVRIEYALCIETRATLSVEAILDGIEIDTDEPCYHEELADLLLARFGGHQVLEAAHHGVNIKTWRGSTSTPQS